MRRTVFKRGPLHILATAVAPMLFTLAIIGAMVYGLNQTERSSRAEGLRILKDGLTRAAVTCYAVEGRYPESVEYIEAHYGVRVDRSAYIVYYDIFASNILPDITVLEIQK